MTNCRRKAKLALCRKLLSIPIAELLPNSKRDHRDLYEQLTAQFLRFCPKCKPGVMAIAGILEPRRFRPL